MNITIIGAGKTGRGFIARLLKEHQITFIDKNKQLVDELNQKGSFSISYFGGAKADETIANYKAYTWEDVKEIKDSIIFVSVGGANLTDVGKELNKYLNKDQKIIVCENASKPQETLYNAIGIEGLEIAESTIFCTTIEKSGLDISSEWYPYLQFNADSFKRGDMVNLDGIKPIKNFGNFLTRKLYTYNSASCIIAYLGYLKGYSVYSDAGNDPEILKLLDHNYEIINECMCLEYGYEKNDQKEFALLSRNKFTDRTIVDTIQRNAREPQRKITASERVVGPLMLERKYNKDSSILEKTLAAMLLYTPAVEDKWNAMLEEKGKEGILKELCQIEPSSELGQRILFLANNPKEII